MDTVDQKDKPVFLIIDDGHRSFRSLSLRIASEHFEPRWAENARKGLKVLDQIGDRVELIMIDLKASGMGGGGFLHHSRRIVPQASVLITTPLGPILYRQGEFYNLEQLNLKNHINPILDALFMGSESHSSNTGPQEEPTRPVAKNHLFDIIGSSPEINEIYGLIERLGPSDATVLISGESGTGKELIARAIHRSSPRKKQPFVPLNCGAIPAELMESELFGHERGAFTGAVNQRLGKFEAADQGTLFLDEVADLDKKLQVKLLRLLQEQEFSRVGSNTVRKADVRVIAATNQDLKKAVTSGLFREDLFYRLNVVPIQIPPLRERREDIPALLSHFSQKVALRTQRSEPVFTSGAFTALLNYEYPGNVRELINIVERILVVSTGKSVDFDDLPVEVQQAAPRESEQRGVLTKLPQDGIRLAEVEKELIVKTLELTGGNKKAAARTLGITRRLLYLRLDQYQIPLSAMVSHQGTRMTAMSPEVAHK